MDHSSEARDPLGEFLTQYNEYLDGNRSYTDLPMMSAPQDTHGRQTMSARADDLVDRFFDARAAIFAHVGYVEEGCARSVDDRRDQFWAVNKAEPDSIKFSPKREALVSWIVDPDAALMSYSDVLYEYSPRHLSKWVYRGVELTLVVVDTLTDGNLQIFCNANEVKVESMVNEAIDHLVAADQTSPAKDVLARVRSLCKQLSIGALRGAIEVHRRNCHQPSCPVLAAMEEQAGSRTESRQS